MYARWNTTDDYNSIMTSLLRRILFEQKFIGSVCELNFIRIVLFVSVSVHFSTLHFYALMWFYCGDGKYNKLEQELLKNEKKIYIANNSSYQTDHIHSGFIAL